MKRTITGLILGVVLVGCAQSPRPHETICGNMDNPPIRLDDRDCELGRPDSRYYSANPAELDSADYTEIGEEIDDDYLEWDPTGESLLPWLGGSGTTTRATSPRTTTPTIRVTPPRTTSASPSTSRSAPRTTAAPRTTRRSG